MGERNYTPLRVLFVTNNDGVGGAARAVIRQMTMLKKSKVLRCEALVIRKSEVFRPEVTQAALPKKSFLNRSFSKFFQKLVRNRSSDFMPASVSLFETGLHQ